MRPRLRTWVWPLVIAVAVTAIATEKARAVYSAVPTKPSHSLVGGPNGANAGQATNGQDFFLYAWVPARLLVRGIDPFSDQSRYVETHYGGQTPASLYTPSTLTILLPFEVLPPRLAATLFTMVDIGLLWLALALLIRPLTAYRTSALLSLGVLVTYGYAAESATYWGQPNGFMLLGATLTARGITRESDRTLAAGLVFLLIKPQFGIPAIVVALAMRRMRAVTVALASTAVLSLPFIVLFVRSAGGISDAARSAASNVRALNAYNADARDRTDLANLITNGHPGSMGLAGQALLLATLCGLGYALLAQARRRAQRLDPIQLSAFLVALMLTSAYHRSLSLIVCAIPVALAIDGRFRGKHIASPVLFVAAAQVAVDFATQPSVRYRLDPQLQHALLWYLPPVVPLALFCCAGAALLRCERLALRSLPAYAD